MNKKNLYFFMSIFTLITLLFTYCFSLQKSLSNKVLRFHILANSNSTFDQNLKLKVRNEVIKYLTPLLKDSKNLEDSKKIISSNITNINNIAQQTVYNFAKYKTTTTLDTSIFPTKHYNNISFPAGKYEALKISIGNAEGNNWWCVMFPPLCLNNSNSITFPKSSSDTLKENLSKDEFFTITNYNKPSIKFKFKLLELLNS